MAARKFRDDNYIVIHGWMINQLHLGGTELMLYALVYGFSQDGDCEYTGSISYMQSATGTSKPTVINTLKKLVSANLIIKTDKEINGVKFCSYRAVTPALDNSTEPTPMRGSKETLPVVKNEQRDSKNLVGGSKETLPNNINNNINNNIEKPININIDSQKETKTLFCNSVFAKNIGREDGTINIDKLIASFRGEPYEDVDLEYYYRTVSDWSDSSNTKRTSRGWVATIRTFIREDEKRGRLRKISHEQRRRRIEELHKEIRKRYLKPTEEDDEIWAMLSVGDTEEKRY
jgi:DNA-binding transcriptional regulator GbsR (MarR family)